MTSREVEQQLGISESTLHRWVRQGRLTPLTRGRGKHCWFAVEEAIGEEAQARGDREATIQALEEALRLFGAAGNVPAQDQPPFVHQLLAEVQRQQQAGSIPPPHSDPSESRMPAAAAEPVPATVPAPCAKRRWWPLGR